MQNTHKRHTFFKRLKIMYLPSTHLLRFKNFVRCKFNFLLEISMFGASMAEKMAAPSIKKRIYPKMRQISRNAPRLCGWLGDA